MTVHGSSPNKSQQQRRAYINGFMRADAAISMDCEWAWRDGAAVGLPQHFDYSPVAAAGGVAGADLLPKL